ncbi:MAG: prenyltransferase/squalene oxidase repeat-containing protein [Planctomycetota bacterium]
MRILFGAVAAPFLAAAFTLPAQSRPIAPRADGAPTMLATERFLFVMRGDVLYQFDVQTLVPLHTFQFPPRGRPPAEGVSAGVVVTDMEVVEEPPPPPPPPPPPGPATEALTASVDAALQWLAEHQDEDGKWDCDGFMKHDDPVVGKVCDGPGNAVHDVGVTALALLAFLGDGHTMRSGAHRESVKKAALWLRDQQQENGLFGTNASHDFIYDHAIAAYAMSETFGLSNYQMLKPYAQKGINYLESHRNPYSVWRYQPRDNDNDTSVTTWAVCALASANFFGLQVNKTALDLASTWYDQVTTPNGRVGYSKAGEPSSRMQGDHAKRFPVENGETMIAAATFGRFMLGQSQASKPILKVSANLLAKKPPRWEPGHIDAVYWFFGTYAMLQMGSAHWHTWNGALGTLLDHQAAEGNAAGSWDAIGVWDEAGGRVFVTALYTLSLEAGSRMSKLKK